MRPPEVSPDSCLRFRCNTFRCSRCAEACPVDAMACDPFPLVNAARCTGCMLCAAACPADAIEAHRMDFHELVAQAPQRARFVIGCEREPSASAHARVPCLGILADEHLIALSALSPRGIQFNATACAGCPSGFVLEPLKTRLAEVKWIGLPENAEFRILATTLRELEYHEPEYDRRSFFHSVAHGVVETSSGILKKGGRGPKIPRSVKRLPPRRELLNASLRHLSASQRSRTCEHQYSDLQFDATCNACGKCAAMCPTGALVRSRRNREKQVEFHAIKCSGCGVCADFCPEDSIQIVRGILDHRQVTQVKAGGNRKQPHHATAEKDFPERAF